MAAALVGVLHVHHAPSHDSRAPFAEVLAAAHAAGLDFVVLTEHVDAEVDGPLPAAERSGVHVDATGHRVLVLVGAEFGTRDGHLLGLGIPTAYACRDRPARDVIDRIHADGGFAVVAHPFSHGGWRDWDAPFDGLEVQNHASQLRGLQGPLLPLRLLRFAFDRDAVLGEMLVRPARELEQWDRLLAAGRAVVGFAGADAHQNLSPLGWSLDPYAQMFRLVRTLCPEGPLVAERLWHELRTGGCRLRWELWADRAGEARAVRFPSGRVELQLDAGRRLLEISQPPPDGPHPAPRRSPGAPRSP
jgi:hypothetical protein